jgi:hypothetical protein
MRIASFVVVLAIAGLQRRNRLASPPEDDATLNFPRDGVVHTWRIIQMAEQRWRSDVFDFSMVDFYNPWLLRSDEFLIFFLAFVTRGDTDFARARAPRGDELHACAHPSVSS